MVTAIEVIVNSNFIVSFDVALIIVKNHASLENLDYEHSGHTGFASSADLEGKQDKLTAGTGISISNNVISVTGGGGDVTEQELTEKLALKQDKLTTGNGISISGSTISAVHTVEVVETGALVKKLYNDIKDYKLVFCYGYRDALSAPNQFMFAFMPDQLQVNGEDLQFLAMAGPSNWQYPVRVKRHSDGYVYWYSGYDYSGNTVFFVTKIVGVK